MYSKFLLVLLLCTSFFKVLSQSTLSVDSTSVQPVLKNLEEGESNGEDTAPQDKSTSSEKENKRAFRCSFLTLDNLAKIAGGVNQAEALDCLNTLLVKLPDGAFILPESPSNETIFQLPTWQSKEAIRRKRFGFPTC